MHCRRRSRSQEDAKNEKKIKLHNNSSSNRTRTKILIRHNFSLRRLHLRESLSTFEQKSTKHRFGLYTRKHNVVVCVCVYIYVFMYIFTLTYTYIIFFSSVV